MSGQQVVRSWVRCTVATACCFLLPLLAGCEQSHPVQLSLRLSGAFPVQTLQVLPQRAELIDEAGRLHVLDLSAAGALLFDPAGGKDVLPVSDVIALPAGRYTGLRLQFADGALLTLPDGTPYLLTQLRTQFTSEIDLRLGDVGSPAITLVMDLKFSLADQRSRTGTFDMAPSVQAVNPATAGFVSGQLAAALVEQADCSHEHAPGEGLAVYAYAGGESAVRDFDMAVQPRPVASALATAANEGSLYAYALPPLAPGDYTLAYTCQADEDDPSRTDAVAFSGSRVIRVGAGQRLVVSFAE